MPSFVVHSVPGSPFGCLTARRRRAYAPPPSNDRGFTIMRSVRAVVLIAVSSTAVLASAAETFNIRPGLWSTRSTMTLSGAPIYVPGMTPAQRAEYAKSWASTINKPEVEDDEDCITVKDLQEAAMLKGFRKGPNACKESNVKVTPTSLSATLDCKDGETTSHTEMNYSASSPTAFKGAFKTSITSPNGVTTMSVAMSGTFKSASCPREDEDDDEDSGDDE